MFNHEPVRSHLTDDEIDGYWKETLSEPERVRVEQHYLECHECQQRAELVEILVAGLKAGPSAAAPANRRSRGWPAVAAFAAAAVLAVLLWPPAGRAPDNPGQPRQSVTEPAATISPLVVTLAPPTRDGDVPTVALGPPTRAMVFELDVREAGAPGTLFDVSLVEPSGERRLQLRAAASSALGQVRVSVEPDLLKPGRFAFEVTSRATTITLPFLVVGSR